MLAKGLSSSMVVEAEERVREVEGFEDAGLEGPLKKGLSSSRKGFSSKQLADIVAFVPV